MTSDSLDEINQIMNDIESLQKNSASESSTQETSLPAEATPEPDMSDFQSGGGEGGSSMEETLGDLGEEQPGTGGLLSVPPAEVVSFPHRSEKKTMSDSHSGGPGTLSMTLRGDMQLELNYESGEQSVSLKFEGGMFVVELADGTEFRVPMKSSKAGTKAA